MFFDVHHRRCPQFFLTSQRSIYGNFSVPYGFFKPQWRKGGALAEHCIRQIGLSVIILNLHDVWKTVRIL